MNLLLLTPSEVSERAETCDLPVAKAPFTAGTFWANERHAQHLCEVLRVETGQVLRAGILGVGSVEAQVLCVSGRRNSARVGLAITAPELEPAPRSKTLLLAAPRPKVLSRCLQHAAALGFTDILIFRSARVDKAHLLSHKAQAPDHAAQLHLGLEQSRRVFMPSVQVFDRFKPFVEDVLPARLPEGPKFLAHPGATTRSHSLAHFTGAYSLAIGPEGGFVPFELELLERAGFLPVSAGDAPLRVECAISYLSGQFDLLSAHL